MNRTTRLPGWLAVALLLICGSGVIAQDWPQWRGPNRDGKTAGFKAPATWPATLNKKWDVPVGSGVSNPSLVGDRLYAFSREGDDEVLRCLNAASGQEIWKKTYAAAPATGSGAGRGLFVGPRATPTVSDGLVFTLGVTGMFTCWDATTGDLKWKKDEFVGVVPSFFTSSSPLVVDGMCIVQLGAGGGRRGGEQQVRGGMFAYDVRTGEEKWRVAAGTPAYSSPMLMTIDGTKVVVAISESQIIAVGAGDGKVMWQLPLRQGQYNAGTPIVDGQTLIFAGPNTGMTAVRLSKQGDALVEQELWRYGDNNLIFNTPVLKNGALYALSTGDNLFCVNSEHATAWTAPIAPALARLFMGGSQNVFAQAAGGQGEGRGGEGRGPREGRGGGQPGRGGGQRGGRAAGGGERAGYGSVVDVGSVMFALSPGGHFVVFQAKPEAYAEVARYKVSEDGEVYSHPIASGNRIYIKDKDSIALFTVE